MIITAGYITSIRTLADKSINITTTTQELTPEQAGKVFSFQGKYIKILFSEEAISEGLQNEVAGLKLDIPVTGKKSKSKQLRDVLYRLHEKQHVTITDGGFEDFYEKQMEIIIEHFKSKL